MIKLVEALIFSLYKRFVCKNEIFSTKLLKQEPRINFQYVMKSFNVHFSDILDENQDIPCTSVFSIVSKWGSQNKPIIAKFEVRWHFHFPSLEAFMVVHWLAIPSVKNNLLFCDECGTIMTWLSRPQLPRFFHDWGLLHCSYFNTDTWNPLQFFSIRQSTFWMFR